MTPGFTAPGWFRETELMWPGQALTLQAEEVLFHEQSAFQDVLIFRSSTYGKVLVLDGVIQLTERDERAYHEMIVHIPMLSHPNPTSVLVVGGGDGGVLREVCRHACVERVTVCEIDPTVVDACKLHLGASTASAFSDPRVRLVHADAAAFVREQRAAYDVVIIDSSDPIGPAETLYTSSFYESLSAAMRPGAVLCNEGECLWLQLPLISELLKHCTTIFPTVDYAFTCVPTYPSGQIGFVLCGKSASGSMRAPVRAPSPRMQAALEYYSPAAHAAAFVLPVFAERVVGPRRRPATPYVCTSAAHVSHTSVVAAAVLGLLVGAAAATALASSRQRS